MQKVLACFDRAYPRLRNQYYAEIIKEIEFTGKLVVPTGWTRRTFLQPTKSKLDLNAAVAHPSQSSSVMSINNALLKTFKFQLATKSKLFRLKAQIHDSIFFQYKPEHKDKVVSQISSYMAEPLTIGSKSFTIPNELDDYGVRWDKS